MRGKLKGTKRFDYELFNSRYFRRRDVRPDCLRLVAGMIASGRLWDSGLCVTGNVSPLLIQALWRLDIVAPATP